MVNFSKHGFAFIIALAIATRLLFLGSAPASLNWDEVSQGYTAYSVLQTGADEWGEKLPLFFRSYGEWKSALYIYLLIPFIKVLGLSAVAIRLPSAIAGIISVYLIYLLGKKIYSEQVGRWAAFLMAVTPWSLLLSRPAFEANVALTLVLAGLYFFLTSSSSRHYSSLILSAIFFGLAPHTYNSAKLVVPLLVLYLVWSTKLYKKLKSVILLFGILAVFAYPVLTNLYSGRAQARYSQVGITTDQKMVTQFYSLRASLPLPPFFQKLILNQPTYILYHLTSNILDYLSPGFLAWHGGDRTQQSLPYHGVLYLSEFVFVLFGLFALFARKDRPLSQVHLPLAIILLGILPAALTREAEHVLRSILAIPGFILLSALGIEYLQTHPSKQLFKWLIGLLIVEIITFMAIYFFWYPRAYARDWQYGHLEVANYLRDHASQYDQIVMTKWYGEPQLFLAFYNHWSPAQYQLDNAQNLRYETEGAVWLDQLQEYSIGKYIFKYLDWPSERRNKRTLYIGKGDDFDDSLTPLSTIRFPDGTVAFKIVAGDQ